MNKLIKKSGVPVAFIILFLISCSRGPVPPANLECFDAFYELRNSLVGTWNSDAIVVGIDTIHNSQNSVLMQINKDEWEDKLKMKPVRTIFNPNKTYVSAYSSADGKVIRMTAGKWEVGKNQLNIHQLFPNDKEMNYRIDMSDGFAELRSTLDFDGDGKKDDMFYCQMKKES